MRLGKNAELSRLLIESCPCPAFNSLGGGENFIRQIGIPRLVLNTCMRALYIYIYTDTCLFCRFQINFDDLISDKWQLVIEGEIGAGSIGDISIDDLVFQDGIIPLTDSTLPPGSTPVPTPGPCPDTQFACQDNTCIPINNQ